MLIRKNTPAEGSCFAWTPKQTPEGTVWLERVHYRWLDHGFGGWEYARWVPEWDYRNGVRRRFLCDKPNQPVKSISESYKRVGNVSCMDRVVEFEGAGWTREQERLFAAGAPQYYTAPPDTSKCRNLRDDGPTPCWHPHCTCMNVGGSKCTG